MMGLKVYQRRRMKEFLMQLQLCAHCKCDFYFVSYDRSIRSPLIAIRICAHIWCLTLWLNMHEALQRINDGSLLKAGLIFGDNAKFMGSDTLVQKCQLQDIRYKPQRFTSRVSGTDWFNLYSYVYRCDCLCHSERCRQTVKTF